MKVSTVSRRTIRYRTRLVRMRPTNRDKCLRGGTNPAPHGGHRRATITPTAVSSSRDRPRRAGHLRVHRREDAVRDGADKPVQEAALRHHSREALRALLARVEL